MSAAKSIQPVLIAGQWRDANCSGTFRAENPADGQLLPAVFPVSTWADCEEALGAALEASEILRTAPPEQIATFLTRFAERIELRAEELVTQAHLETGLPKLPRLAQIELSRTTDQLRQAATAALEGSWAMPTIDTKLNIRSVLGPVGPVLVFGPNNFPFAYSGICGGDFVSAIVAGNPVIAKAHPCHPATTKLLAEEALAAGLEAGLPAATVQMIYHLAPEDGLRLISDKRLRAIGFTGSRNTGLKLKAAADAVGKPIYLELSSFNPVVILPGALAERGEKIVEEFTNSCLLSSGQFCTSPGMTILFEGANTEKFIAEVKAKLESVPPAVLLSSTVVQGLVASVKVWREAGAEVVTGGSICHQPGNRFENTLLRVSGEKFLESPEIFQTEAFGNASLAVVVRDGSQAAQILSQFEGNLTGSIYSDSRGSDDQLYARLAPLLRARVGRFLNDKMPTGVAVTAAMNHGGPFPATGHPGFTAVGIPASLRRFTQLQCYDHVRPERLPVALQNKNPNGKMWRLIDGQWSRSDV